MKLQFGKRGDPTLSAANSNGSRTSNFFVRDEITKNKFLIDIGSDLCVFPRTPVKVETEKSSYQIHAANETTISTYVTKTHHIDLGLQRALEWKFVVADVAKSIIGADFVDHLSL